MARTKALDYEDKRTRIKEMAVKLFAKKGFHSTSITDISDACQTSKSRLYHYFDSKEQILFELLEDHADTLQAIAETALADTDGCPRARLRNYARALLEVNVKSKARHSIILSELDKLPRRQNAEIARKLRKPIEALYDTLSEINPQLKQNASLNFPSAMIFLGMLNWTHTWFSEKGDVSVDAFADLICDTFLQGFTTAQITKP